MGLGGYLTWTAAFRELKEKKLEKEVKILPCEVHGNQITKIVKDQVFDNNPYVYNESTDQGLKVFALPLNLYETNYCRKDTPTRAYHRYDKHIIEQICEHYGIEDPDLKCELYFTNEERRRVDKILTQNNVPSDFVIVEPQTKDSYTVNKSYPFVKWQNIVNQLTKKGICVVQIGQKTKDKNLQNVINLTGMTSFREAACIISRSKLLISAEGGLMHAANAVDTKSVILYTGFISPVMTGYRNNVNLWIGEKHGPCGMKTTCDKCKQEVESHDEDEVVKVVMREMHG